MDKRYYYRVLGVREGASTAEIKTAYDKHMRRLALPDYADDPEYVARKKDQIRHAYAVLMGGSVHTADKHRKASLEKRKDAEDAGEDALAGLKKSFQRHTRSCESAAEISVNLGEAKEKLTQLAEGLRAMTISADSSHMGDESRRTPYRPSNEEEGSSGSGQSRFLKLLVSVIVGLSLFSSLITACGSMVVNIADEVVSGFTSGAEPEYIFEGAAVPAEPDEEGEFYLAESAERIERILEHNHKYDFYGALDQTTQEKFLDQVEWDISEETREYIWQNTADLAENLGVCSVADIVTYMSGSSDRYWEQDDYSNAQIVAKLMNAPAYEEIAGSCSLYSREIILNYNGYLRYLCDVALYQSQVAEGTA